MTTDTARPSPDIAFGSRDGVKLRIVRARGGQDPAARELPTHPRSAAARADGVVRPARASDDRSHRARSPHDRRRGPTSLDRMGARSNLRAYGTLLNLKPSIVESGARIREGRQRVQ